MRAVVVLLALVAAAALPESLAAQPHEQTVYASVLDKDGHPVAGLGVADFVVKEDGASREVLRAGRTADPIDLAIIVDTSTAIQPYQNDFRKALTAFVTRMAGQHSANVALLAMADRPTILADYTTSVAELTKAVQRIFAQPGSGMVFQDAVSDSVKGLRQHDNPRRAIVVITTEGTDFSNVPYERTLEMLQESGRRIPRPRDYRSGRRRHPRSARARACDRHRSRHTRDRREARRPVVEHGAVERARSPRRRPVTAIQGGVRASGLACATKEDRRRGQAPGRGDACDTGSTEVWSVTCDGFYLGF